MAKIVVIGATGLLGSKIAEAALIQEHAVILITRARTAKNEAQLDLFSNLGAEIAIASVTDLHTMTERLQGVDAVVCAVAGEVEAIRSIEYPLLSAAKAAKVKRFIPNEFGLDTLRLPMGTGAIFDEKKRFQQAIKDSGVAYTIVFNGGIFDYFLPNLREEPAIMTFGDRLDLPFYTHAREDIGAITVRAALDDRCKNQYVHLKYNLVTQSETHEILQANYPDYDFPRGYMSNEEIMDGTHEVKTAVWIEGHCGKADPACLDPAELYPDHRHISVSDALSNPRFVFGDRLPWASPP